jgi:hypothetical protein
MGIMQSLARIVSPRQKTNPAGEGNYHPGPYTVGGGVLPSAWGQFLNYWQMDYDPLSPGQGCSTVEACVWAYIRAIAQLPGYHKRARDDGGTDTVTTSALARLLRSPSDYQTSSDFLVIWFARCLYRQFPLSHNATPPGSDSAALDQPVPGREIRSRPALRRNSLRDRRQPAVDCRAWPAIN